jgi:translation initiation factor 5B
MMRKPIITVLGHVDAGKTKMLDAIRGTAIAEKEAGGITQHIGATEVPINVITKIAKPIAEKYKFNIKIPGLLFIDTPGHEAFTNLRKRGGSIADLSVLVVDIHNGLQEQTIEAIEILKTYKCPFVVAVNKIDTIQGWIGKEGSFSESIEMQRKEVVEALDVKIYSIVGQLHSKGFASERFDRVKDFTKEIAILPISAKGRIGIQELLVFLAALSQRYLEKKLEIHEKGNCKGTVLEVKEGKGLGTTIDVILYEGRISVGEKIIVGGRNGIIRTKIRALLEPKPVGDKSNEKYNCVKEVHAAAGVKISAPSLDDAISGSPLRHESEEAEKEIMDEIKKVKFESDAVGPIVRSNTLGSLEALVKLLHDKGIKVKKADIGEIQRVDVLEVLPVREKDKFKGVIFAFHTGISEQAEVEAKKRGVKIFKNDVVYRLLEEYDAWISAEKANEKMQKLSNITLPAKFEVLRGFVFRRSNPAIVGIKVLEGKLRKGVEVINKGKIVGRVQSLQSEGKNIEEAVKGMEIAVSIEGGVVDKGFSEGDILYSFIPLRQFSEIEDIVDVFSKEELQLLGEIKIMSQEIEGYT